MSQPIVPRILIGTQMMISRAILRAEESMWQSSKRLLKKYQIIRSRSIKYLKDMRRSFFRIISGLRGSENRRKVKQMRPRKLKKLRIIRERFWKRK